VPQVVNEASATDTATVNTSDLTSRGSVEPAVLQVVGQVIELR